MPTLREDITTQAKWIVQAFGADKLKLDNSLDSFKQIDTFFDMHVRNGQPVANGRLAQGSGAILFAIGAYMGQVFIKSIPGAKWVYDENDPDAELNVYLLLPSGTQIFPIQRAIKRFQNGSEDGIYAYGQVVATGEGVTSTAVKKWWEVWK